MLIHVGYPKSASSWLQHCLFANGASSFHSPWLPVDIVEKLCLRNALTFDPAAVRREFSDGIDEASRLGKIPVVSHEFLVGRPDKSSCFAKEFAARVAATFPEARVLIIIREQRKAAISWYREFMREGKRLTAREFIARPRRGFEPSFDLDYLEYPAVISHYYCLFGQDRVLVLPMELLIRDQGDFLTRIGSFVGAKCVAKDGGAPVRKGYSALTLVLHRWANTFYRAIPARPLPWHQRLARNALSRFEQVTPPRLHAPIERRLSRLIAGSIGSYYARSNRLASELVGIDLRPLGYVCDPP